VQVSGDDQIMLITNGGTLVRTNVSEVSVLGRNTQGVRLIRLTDEEKLVELAAIDEAEFSSSEGEEDDTDTGAETAGDASAANAQGGDAPEDASAKTDDDADAGDAHADDVDDDSPA
jgi:DNA gyrase subunit A